jgi:two-component system response regulator MprA
MLPRLATPLHDSSNRSPGILVADDDAAVLDFLKRGLSLYGFTVWAAKDGKEAVEIYQANHDAIAAALLDVRMPDLDGPGTLEMLRRIDPQVVCCFMSGDLGKYTQDELLACGAAQVLFKPFPLSEVVQTLQAILKGYETQVA